MAASSPGGCWLRGTSTVKRSKYSRALTRLPRRRLVAHRGHLGRAPLLPPSLHHALHGAHAGLHSLLRQQRRDDDRIALGRPFPQPRPLPRGAARGTRGVRAPDGLEAGSRSPRLLPACAATTSRRDSFLQSHAHAARSTSGRLR
jgi:hypothetical protein